MAEGLISVLLEKLASVFHQQVHPEVNLVGNVKKEVAKLIHSFGAIEAVLKDAEERQVKEASVRFWLDRLKDVSYEVEDMLDEWNTKILWLQIEKEGGNAPAATTKTVSQCIPAPFFCFGQVSRVIFPHDFPGKIQELNKRLASIVNKRQNYNFQYTNSGGIVQIKRQKTTSFVDKTFGRVDEKQLFVSKLLSGSSQEGTIPLVIPIVGMGGIGKTTLAQLAYNDVGVKANFTKRIWVCVSDPFDEINIAKAIIDNLNENDVSNSNNLQALLERIERNIKEQEHKFLLVLDDVWNEDYTKWEQIKVSLQHGVVGSRILVTTRNEKVAKMMATTNNIIHLTVLSEEYCWSIFYYMALEDRERSETSVLRPLGKEIVKKCQGLPLVAKTLGGLMRYKITKREWEVVLNSKIWELDIFGNHVFQSLYLSYHDLAPTIKQCLLYCVTFPKDHKIDVDILIELWMSQDYLNLHGNKEITMLDIGKSYFNSLVMRSFFQDFEKDEIGNVNYCKMHDIVHDFLQFFTKDECFIIGAKGGEERIVLRADNKFRHLTITFAGKGPFPVSFDNCKSLRTITSFDCQITSLSLGPELILQLKYVRTLILSCNQLEEVPEEVGGLVHLRYLDLSRNRELEKLPDTLCNLVNLQTLMLVRCESLEELPEDMGKLTNLRHLHVKDCWELKLPKIIGRLTSVETLDRVTIWGHDDVIYNNEAVFKLSDLRNMDHLNGSLSIYWDGKGERKDAASDADKAKLVNKKHLLSLKLSFWSSLSGSMIQEEILSALQPNPNLESLVINGYSGTTLCPHWMKNMNNLTNLTRLTFEDCCVCEVVPLSVLGNLGSLETLIFEWMTKVKKVEFENSTSSSSLEQVLFPLSKIKNQVLFPSLKHLKFYWMPKWEEWSDLDQESDCVAMPCLSTLRIEDCPNLKALPHFLWKTQLQELTIFDNQDYSGTTLYHHWMKNMNNLTRLALEGCGICDVVSLSVLGNLRSLETLKFGKTHKVKKVEFETSTSSSSLEQVLFPSLKHLEFYSMGEWEEWSDLDQESDCVAMPCLSTLTIRICWNLKALPHFLRKTQLQELTITYCRILSESCQNGRGKEWPPNIRIDGKTVQKDGVWIQQEEDRDWINWTKEEEGIPKKKKPKSN